MLIQMTKAEYIEKYCFDGKISEGILEKHEFLPDRVIVSKPSAEELEKFWNNA
jgi:hypothetical protein